MLLAEIEDHIRSFDAKIAERTRAYQNEVIYDIVAKGLMLLKARETHLKQGQKTLVETVSTSAKKQARALAKQEEEGERGFLAWLESRFPGQSSRTARNYMNAARNCALTSDHDLDDVEALRQAQALHEKKPTDLYRLTDTPPPPPGNSEQPRNLVTEVQMELFGVLDQVVSVRDDMSADQYEAAWIRMKETLEKFTGAAWEMVNTSSHGEHGEEHVATAKKTAKRTKAAGRKK